MPAHCESEAAEFGFELVVDHLGVRSTEEGGSDESGPMRPGIATVAIRQKEVVVGGIQLQLTANSLAQPDF